MMKLKNRDKLIDIKLAKTLNDKAHEYDEKKETIENKIVDENEGREIQSEKRYLGNKEESIKVAVRIRPMNELELTRSDRSCISGIDMNNLLFKAK